MKFTMFKEKKLKMELELEENVTSVELAQALIEAYFSIMENKGGYHQIDEEEAGKIYEDFFVGLGKEIAFNVFMSVMDLGVYVSAKPVEIVQIYLEQHSDIENNYWINGSFKKEFNQ